MADSIDPTAGVETLGSIMARKFKATAEAGYKGEVLALPVALETQEADNYSATVAYTPGWSAQGLEEGLATQRPDFLADASAGIHDLSLPALKALGEFAVLRSEAVGNTFTLASVLSDPVGHRRGTSLLTGRGGKNPFVPPPDITIDGDSPAALDHNEGQTNFESLAGGITANADGGGFFGADRLGSLLSKDLETVYDVRGNPIGLSAHSYTGDTLLQNARKKREKDSAGTELQNIPQSVQSVLEETNRFSPNKPPDEGGEEASQTPFLKGAQSGKKFQPPGETLSEFDALTKGLWSVQTGQSELGKFDPDAPFADVRKLKTIALQTMLAVGGHRSLAKDGAGGFDASLAALIPSLTQIGAARMGIYTTRVHKQHGAEHLNLDSQNEGLNADDEKAKRLFNSLGNDDFMAINEGDMTMGIGPPSENDYTSAPQGGSTYGTMNSFLEPFDGPFPVGMFFISLYGLLATALAGGLIEGLLPTDDESVRPYNAQDPASLGMGSSSGRDEDIYDMFMILFGFPRRLSTNFARCLTLGLMAFYGFPFPPQQISLSKVFDVAISLALAPGYFATITKQVLRDFEQISKSIAGFGDVSGLLILTQVFKVVDSLVSSTTFKFIMTMIKIGSIMYAANYKRGPAGQQMDSTQAAERLNRAINGKIRHQLSRFYTGGGAFVSPLSLTKHPSALLLPTSVWNAPSAGALRGEDGSWAAENGHKDWEPGAEGGGLLMGADPLSWVDTKAENFDRISKNTVKLVEQALDTEYVPFYFHDLRTNEILAMPAFVTAYNESFAPEYTSTHGFGRTDPVRIYNKTERSINLTFKLVAMNPNDHTFMWYLINKLVAMCYPQKSIGRIRTAGKDTKFIQPFSQVPTSSPVIRMRLGELFHSNYSIINLASMFGHPGPFSVGQGENAEVKTIRTNMTERAGLHRTTAYWITAKKNFKELDQYLYVGPAVIPPGIIATTSDGVPNLTGGDINAITISDGSDHPLLINVDFMIKDYAAAKITGYSWADGLDVEAWPQLSETDRMTLLGKVVVYVEFELMFEANGEDEAGEPTDIVARVGGVALVNALTEGGAAGSVKVKIPISVVQQHRATIIADKGHTKDAVNELLSSKFTGVNKNDPEEEEVNNFFKSENNAIVRSFEATGGKGLAGVITSLSLNYDGATWVTTPESLNARAPKSVEISLAFAPIHDLPLGLDYRGRLTAPSHPVGDMAHMDTYGKTVLPQPPGIKGSTTPDEAVLTNSIASGAGADVDVLMGTASDGTDATGADVPPSPLGAMMGSLPISLPSIPGLDLGSIMNGGGLPF